MKKLLAFIATLAATFVACSGTEGEGGAGSAELAGQVSQALNTCDPNFADSIPQTTGNATVGAVATASPWTPPGRINKLLATGDGWDITYTPVSGPPVTTHIGFGPGVVCTHEQAGGWDMPSPSDNLRKITMWAEAYRMTFAINDSSQPMNVWRCTGMQADAANRNTHVGFSAASGTKISMIAPGADPQSLVFTGVSSTGVTSSTTVKFYGPCHLGDNTAPLHGFPAMDTTPQLDETGVRDLANRDAAFDVFSTAGFTSVELFVDGVAQGTDTTTYNSSGINYAWSPTADIAPGFHDFKAIGTFSGGQKVWHEKRLLFVKSEVASGGYFNCYLSGNRVGTVTCRGQNNYGQLGRGTTSASASPRAPVIPGAGPAFAAGELGRVTDLSVGLENACVVVDGGVLCWGRNAYGILGVTPGSLAHSASPVQVIPSNSGVTAVSVGGAHACAIFSGTPKLKCWGHGGYGQLGNGSTTATNITPAEPTQNATSAIQVNTLRDSTFWLTSAGDVITVGRDNYGQLGNDPTLLNKSLAFRIFGAGSGGVVHKLWSGWYHGCVQLAAGGIKCWGSNGFGGLGDGTTTQRPTPVDATAWSSYGVAEMALGDDSSCIRSSSGGLYCLGYNGNGQHGNGTTSNSLSAVLVTGTPGAVTYSQVSQGWGNFCAVGDAGAHLKCAGDNSYGQQGGSNPATTLQSM